MRRPQRGTVGGLIGKGGVADPGDVESVKPRAVGSILAVQARHDDPRVHARRRHTPDELF